VTEDERTHDRARVPTDATLRVLVAEDEEHLGVLVAQFLRGRGLDVALERDGVAAVARLTAEPFDVAVVDVQMPGLDGLAVLERARQLPRAPEVIVATGNGAVEAVMAALRGGAYDAVAKPYRMAEVELLVRRAAEKRRLLDEVEALRAEVARLRGAGAPPA
jgi:DNA-binding NtrC family response regulator